MTVTTINPATEEVIKTYDYMSREKVMEILNTNRKAFLEGSRDKPDLLRNNSIYHTFFQT